jgi:hypothetical protein
VYWLWAFHGKNPNMTTQYGQNDTKPTELCFAKFGQPNVRGYSDKYTLRLMLSGEGGIQATGELKLLPAEKDSKVGKFTGVVSAVDKIAMARTASLWWDTLAEGMNTKEELKITFGEGTANIGFGEMVDRGDGVYVYKDATKLNYSLSLTDVACSDLTTN